MRNYLPGQAPRQRELTTLLEGENLTFEVVTNVSFTTSKKKTRSLRVKNGKVEWVTAESDWVDAT